MTRPVQAQESRSRRLPAPSGAVPCARASTSPQAEATAMATGFCAAPVAAGHEARRRKVTRLPALRRSDATRARPAGPLARVVLPPQAARRAKSQKGCPLRRLGMERSRCRLCAMQALRASGPGYWVWRTLIARQSSAISKGLHSAALGRATSLPRSSGCAVIRMIGTRGLLFLIIRSSAKP